MDLEGVNSTDLGGDMSTMATTTHSLPYEVYLLKCDIRAHNQMFRAAIEQVIALNDRIVNLKSRYERARDVNRRSFRYSTRLRLCCIEGTRNMFFEYANVECTIIEELQTRLRDLAGIEYDFGYEHNNFDEDEDSEEEDDEDEEEMDWRVYEEDASMLEEEEENAGEDSSSEEDESMLEEEEEKVEEDASSDESDGGSTGE